MVIQLGLEIRVDLPEREHDILKVAELVSQLTVCPGAHQQSVIKQFMVVVCELEGSGVNEDGLHLQEPHHQRVVPRCVTLVCQNQHGHLSFVLKNGANGIYWDCAPTIESRTIRALGEAG